MLRKNWSNLYLVDDYYLIKNIRFMKNDKPYELKELVISWEDLAAHTNFASDFTNKQQALAAYYRAQLFLDADVEFELERVTDKNLRDHILEVNEQLEHLQPYSTTFDNAGLQSYTVDELVKYNYSSTWFAIIPADFELACQYLNEDQAQLMREQCAFEIMLNTMPIEIVGSMVLDTRNRIHKKPTTFAEYKKCLVNNSLQFPTVSEMSLQYYKFFCEAAITDERFN
jgi:hypothetical protein